MDIRAKIFKSGGSQAVRIPKELRLPGKEVRIRKVPGGLLLEPVITDIDEWLARLDAYREEHGLMDIVVEEPELPPDDIRFD